MIKPFLALGLAVALFSEASFAQLTLDPGGNYTQNFDTLASGLPTGWSVRTNVTASSLGLLANPASATTAWSSTTGQFANYCSTVNNSTNLVGNETTAIQAGIGNRALGVRQTAAIGDPGAGTLLQLSSTAGFTNFQVSLDFLMLSVQARSTIWTMDYGIGAVPSSFTVITNFPDPGAFGATHMTASFDGALDNVSDTVWIRIAALAASSGSGTRDTFGIDNFVLTYQQGAGVTNPPTITAEPTSRTNNAGTTATFNVAVTGTQPLTYQWQKNGGNIGNGGNVAGATSPTLSLTAVTVADVASYSCTITNVGGLTNTSVATLTVIDPAINTQPVSSTNLLGESQTFSVSAAGTPTLVYQWLKNGSPIGGATNNSITFAPIALSDFASYSVIVSNTINAVTSSVATLSQITTPAIQIAQWNFNDTNSPVATPAASLGSGAASWVGGVSAIYAGGVTQDPKPTGTNTDWDFGSFPAATVGDKTAGAQFKFSTAGYKDIFVTWHEMHTSTASRYAQLQYSTDGVAFNDFQLITRTNTAFDRQVVDLSSISGVNNNPNFAFRIVSEFEFSAIGGSGTNAYIGSSAGYATSGRIHLDWFNVFANTNVAAPRIDAALTGNNIVLNWTASGYSLQAAPLATGVYTNVPGATSPYTNPVTGTQKFFQLKGN